MLVRKVFKKQMKEFAVQMMEEYVKTTDNDVDDQLVARVRKAMRLGEEDIFIGTEKALKKSRKKGKIKGDRKKN